MSSSYGFVPKKGKEYIEFEGLLSKRGTNLFDSYQSRWCILCLNEATLEWELKYHVMKSGEQGDLKGVISLVGAKIKQGTKYMFTIESHENEIHYMRAKSAGDLSNWIEKLELAISDSFVPLLDKDEITLMKAKEERRKKLEKMNEPPPLLPSPTPAPPPLVSLAPPPMLHTEVRRKELQDENLQSGKEEQNNVPSDLVHEESVNTSSDNLEHVEYWQQCTDVNSNQYYYYNHESSVVSWERPTGAHQHIVYPNVENTKILEKRSTESVDSEIQDEWQECLDEASSRYYYYNPKTQCTQWERPVASIISNNQISNTPAKLLQQTPLQAQSPNLNERTILSHVDITAIQNVVQMESDLMNIVQIQHAENTKQEQMKSILYGDEVKKEYFIQFILKLKSFLTACEATHSGLVDHADFRLGDEMSKFASDVSKSGGMRKAASNFRWMHSIAEVISVIKQQFQAVPFLNGACSLIECLLKQQDENNQKLNMFRGAMFSTMASLLYGTSDQLLQTVCLNIMKFKNFDNEIDNQDDPMKLYAKNVQSKIPGFKHLSNLASKLVGEKMSVGEVMALADVTIITNGIFDGSISCELTDKSLEEQLTNAILGSDVSMVLSEFKTFKLDEIELSEKALSHLGFDSGNLLNDPEAGEILTRDELKQALVDVGAGSKATGMSLRLRRQLDDRFHWSIKPANNEEVQIMKKHIELQNEKIEKLLEKSSVMKSSTEGGGATELVVKPANDQDVKALKRELTELKNKLKKMVPEESSVGGGGLASAMLPASSSKSNSQDSSKYLQLEKEMAAIQAQLAQVSTNQVLLGYHTGLELNESDSMSIDEPQSYTKDQNELFG